MDAAAAGKKSLTGQRVKLHFTVVLCVIFTSQHVQQNKGGKSDELTDICYPFSGNFSQWRLFELGI